MWPSVEADVAVGIPEIGFVNSFIYECPAGAEGQQLNLICDSPSQTCTAYLTSGTVPNQSTLEQTTGSNGAASFDVTPGNLSLWPGIDTETRRSSPPPARRSSAATMVRRLAATSSRPWAVPVTSSLSPLVERSSAPSTWSSRICRRWTSPTSRS